MKQPSILLNQYAGWNSALLDHVALADAGCTLRLRLLPGIARPLTSAFGDLGGFTNPAGLALDGLDRMYVLDGADCLVKRFDPCLQSFQVLPCIGGCGHQARQINAPRGMDISCRDELFIADTGNFRVPVYSIKGLALRTILGPYVVTQNAGVISLECAVIMRPSPAAQDCSKSVSLPRGLWAPSDVVTSATGWLYVADYNNGLIHLFDPHLYWRGAYDGSSASSPALVKPIRIALDKTCRTYIVQEGADHVVVLDRDGRFVANLVAPEDLQGRFCPAAVAVDNAGTIHITNQYTSTITQYEEKEDGCFCCVSSGAGTGSGTGDLAFDLQGNYIALSGKQVVTMSAAAVYEPQGTFLSAALDSRLYRCPWHRVVMQGNIATGTQIRVETFTAEDAKSTLEIQSLPEDRWTLCATNSTVGQGRWDCLVQSPPGRYLWLRLTLLSDGQNSPCVDWLRLIYPRQSSLQYLPGAYSDDEASRHFLDQFLSIFDTIRDGIGARIAHVAALFDPMATPATSPRPNELDFLSWLAGWLGLVMDQHWPEARRRTLLKNAWKLYRLRGTPEGLRLHLQLYMGIDPQILEHFKLRRWMRTGGTRLGDNSALWGADIVDRLQLNVHAQLNTVQLIDTGDPLTDPFSKEAHQFTVFLPMRGQMSTDPQGDALQLQTVQRIIDMSKPAHTLGYLQMTRPRFRIGIQSFIGKDTVVANYPEEIVDGQSKLGYDSVLGQSPEEKASPVMRLGTSTRIGTDTLLN
jgi:phage tail-like protein